MPLLSAALCVTDGHRHHRVMGALVVTARHFHLGRPLGKSSLNDLAHPLFRNFHAISRRGGGLNAAFEMFHFYDYNVPRPFGRCPAFLSVSSKTCKMPANDARKSLPPQIWTLLIARDPLSEKDVRGGVKPGCKIRN